MSDTDKRGVAHVHPRLMPHRRAFDERNIGFQRPYSDAFILPDHNTFGHMDLRWLVDNLDNEEGGDE